MTLGTAGHIDHGKTALVGALTGRNTDRLPQERARGISIELGYAALELPSGRRVSVVDVPGHERFVRTMVAGASGIDFFLLCVASDDGLMPQTYEHVAVLRALGVDRGVVAVTKADIGFPELAAEEVRELLPDKPVVAVSAVTGEGLDELRAALDDVAATLPDRDHAGAGVRLHVDRSFTLRGIGTVVTGTLWSGTVAAGDTITILPRGVAARVRSVQVHDEPVERAGAGQRVALNLVGVGWREVSRGDVVVDDASALGASYLVDAALTVEAGRRAVPRGTRLHVHHGTRESAARVVPLAGEELRPGERAYAQLRLEAPLMAAAGDRLVLRQVAPPDTIGGGVVVDPAPRKHGPSAAVVEDLAALERGERREPEPEPEAPAEPEPEPLDADAMRLLDLLRADGAQPRTDADLAVAASLTPGEAAARFRRLEQEALVVRVGRNQHFEREALEMLEAQVVAVCERDGAATIAGLRDELGTSRKYAQALLEHLDRAKVTRRDGDVHVLRRARP
jgi:selenocysteine-specific elongation factor